MHFNNKKEENINSLSPSVFEALNFNLNRLIAVDTITVDRNSRLTFSKDVRRILRIEPGDKISVYRDKYNANEALFRIQRGRNLVNNWKLKREVVGIDYDEKKYPVSTVSTSTLNGLGTYSCGNAAPYRVRIDNKIRNIMLVDDEQDTLYSLQLILSDEGYNVIPFSKPREAVKNLIDLNDSSTKYDLAIIDIRMPELNGIQLYQILKIIDKKIKVMFISALEATDEILSMFPEINSSNIVSKPVSRSYFVDKVKEIIVN